MPGFVCERMGWQTYQGPFAQYHLHKHLNNCSYAQPVVCDCYIITAVASSKLEVDPIHKFNDLHFWHVKEKRGTPASPPHFNAYFHLRKMIYFLVRNYVDKISKILNNNPFHVSHKCSPKINMTLWTRLSNNAGSLFMCPFLVRLNSQGAPQFNSNWYDGRDIYRVKWKNRHL